MLCNIEPAKAGTYHSSCTRTSSFWAPTVLRRRVSVSSHNGGMLSRFSSFTAVLPSYADLATLCRGPKDESPPISPQKCLEIAPGVLWGLGQGPTAATAAVACSSLPKCLLCLIFCCSTFSLPTHPPTTLQWPPLRPSSPHLAWPGHD